MKKIVLPFFIVALIFIGCSKTTIKTNSTTSVDNSLILGKWYLTVDSIQNYTANVYQNSEVNNYSRNAAITFNKDGSGSETVVDDSVTTTVIFNYSIIGSDLVVNYPAQTVNGNALNATSVTNAIKTLTSASLNLYSETDYLDGKDQDKSLEWTYCTR